MMIVELSVPWELNIPRARLDAQAKMDYWAKLYEILEKTNFTTPTNVTLRQRQLNQEVDINTLEMENILFTWREDIGTLVPKVDIGSEGEEESDEDASETFMDDDQFEQDLAERFEGVEELLFGDENEGSIEEENDQVDRMKDDECEDPVTETIHETGIRGPVVSSPVHQQNVDEAHTPPIVLLRAQSTETVELQLPSTLKGAVLPENKQPARKKEPPKEGSGFCWKKQTFLNVVTLPERKALSQSSRSLQDKPCDYFQKFFTNELLDSIRRSAALTSVIPVVGQRRGSPDQLTQ
ncbi:hypothetical protein GE061_000011 [Apolygus lucorum]|uniref:Uncharacterized protein n=1 Tax=Apolygus lucorum TaxID=248454 RepID=A0A8S9Y325_APOLU|nr:hypothetical protein GE061_000011 [Apolygus lucorum]